MPVPPLLVLLPLLVVLPVDPDAEDVLLLEEPVEPVAPLVDEALDALPVTEVPLDVPLFALVELLAPDEPFAPDELLDPDELPCWLPVPLPPADPVPDDELSPGDVPSVPPHAPTHSASEMPNAPSAVFGVFI